MPLKYSFLFIILLLSATNDSHAQNNKGDTLNAFIKRISAKADDYVTEGKYDSAVALQLGLLTNKMIPGVRKIKTCLRIAMTYQQVGSTAMMDLYLSKAKYIADTMHTPAMDSLYMGGFCFLKANTYNNNGKYDSAVYYAKKGIPYFLAPTYKRTTFVPTFYEILGSSLYRIDKNNIKKSIAFYDSAIAHIDTLENTHYYDVLLNKAQVLKDNKEYKAALNNFLTVYHAKPLQNTPRLLLWATQGITNCYENLHDLRNAIYYSKQTNELTEKLYGPAQLEGFKKAEIEYRERENKDLATINAQEQSIVKAQRSQLIIAIAALILLGLGAFLLYRNRQLLNKQKDIAETQSKQLQQLDAINKKIFATISHDLNSPLITLESLFELMGVQVDDQSSSLFYRDVRQQLYSCNQVLQNLLQWSRAELGQHIDTTDKVDALDTIKEIVEQSGYLSKPKNIHINIANLDDSNHLVPTELFKIVSRNLLNNAIKFSPIGSTIDIACKLEADGTVVSFTNIGQLKEDILNNLFKGVVISTKGTGYETGYGLGLYITAQLMQKIGGKVVAENNINGTCTFTLYFNNKADAGYSTTG